MVNLASRTFDDNKNLLLAHSKKIKKQSISETHSSKSHDSKTQQIDPHFFQKNQILTNFTNFQPKTNFIRAFDEINTAQSFKFEHYHPFYNLVFCPDVVQEIFSSKNSMNIVEMRQKMLKLKTPINDTGFEKNLEKMRVLSNNQDLLLQNYLKDKYTNSGLPNPKLLKEYYRYTKAKLSLSQAIEEKHNDLKLHLNNCGQISQNPIQDELFEQPEFNGNLNFGHRFPNNQSQIQNFSNQTFLHPILNNPLSFFNTQDFDGNRYFKKKMMVFK